MYKTRFDVNFLDFSLVAGRNSDAEYQAENCFHKYFRRCSHNVSKNIVLNLLRYFIRPCPFYFQANGVYRPVSSVATTLLSLREVWGSFLGLVKSDTVSPVARHRWDYIFGVRSCVAQELSRVAPALVHASADNTDSIIKI